MNKSTHFTGQPIFSQLIKFIPKSLVYQSAQQYKADRYCKYFDTWHHLITMLFACYGNCTSLREIVTGMRVLEGKLSSAGVKNFPKKSTFSDANKRRQADVFAEIYYRLRAHWKAFLPDSQSHSSNIHIIDSTTISLFQEIFKGSGLSKADGRRKGGLKVHTALQANEFSPYQIKITNGATNDIGFLNELSLPPGSILVMDKGYRSYQKYKEWTQQEVIFVTRHRPYTYLERLERFTVSNRERLHGVREDEMVQLGHPAKKNKKVIVRLITFYDKDNKREFKFITNDFKTSPSIIAGFYKKRWKIELLFKRLKQNMPLQYFLGDNQNAIKIQIYCALISDLLIQIIKKQVTRNWAFSNVVSLIRLHLFNYVNLISFLKNPEKCKIASDIETYQLKLNLSG